MLLPVTLRLSPSFFLLRFRPPAPFTTEVVATLSTEGDREYRKGESTVSEVGENWLRSCEGLRFFAAPATELEMLERLRGMLSWGMCGGEAILRYCPGTGERVWWESS